MRKKKGRSFFLFLLLVLIPLFSTGFIVINQAPHITKKANPPYLIFVLIPILGLIFVRRFSLYINRKFSGFIKEEDLLLFVEILSISTLSLLGNSASLLLLFVANSFGFSILSLIITFFGALLYFKDLGGNR